jgi:hypothetical protein
MAHITIATPMYGGMCSGVYMKSVLELVKALSNSGHTANFIDIANESLITRARNLLTEMFLRSNSDYLLFIDADEGFGADGIIKMISEEVDLIGAAVPMKGINWERVRKAAKEDKPDLEKFTAIYNVNMSPDQREKLRENPKNIVEVDYMGTGLMLISRKVFETIKKDIPQYRCDQQEVGSIVFGDPIYDFWQAIIDHDSERLLSEDYQFCKLWKMSGGKIYLAPYVRVQHVGTYWFK